MMVNYECKYNVLSGTSNYFLYKYNIPTTNITLLVYKACIYEVSFSSGI